MWEERKGQGMRQEEERVRGGGGGLEIEWEVERILSVESLWKFCGKFVGNVRKMCGTFMWSKWKQKGMVAKHMPCICKLMK